MCFVNLTGHWPSCVHKCGSITTSLVANSSGAYCQLYALCTLEAIEKDAQGVTSSLSSLLWSVLLTITSSFVQHLECYKNVAGRVLGGALDAAVKGNRFINECLRLNEEMKGMITLATQIKVLRKRVGYLVVGALLRWPMSSKCIGRSPCVSLLSFDSRNA
ncbi:hypothetical protein L7F22_045366 [Adiantum nelumboides]|nr:hypothetical protein [Adiantum nelumboides]